MPLFHTVDGLDLKFKNDTGKELKLYVNSDDDSVDVRIVEMS